MGPRPERRSRLSPPASVPRRPEPRPPGVPDPGDLVFLDGRASVQFGGNRALWLRVSSIGDRPTYDGWVWLTGYAIDPSTGEALARREVFAQIAGLQINPQPAGPSGTARRTTRRRGV
ncbi:hypothetical protein [Micromonospora zingiberis]|uniref:hypothetical protein n=1 Tax=Micromonospora zingiberis TaxID=2053011 RepID=UPI001F0EC130|nr:hypothetical protein [Micromonospora zingiberis]